MEKRRIIGLSADELDKLFGEAAQNAVKEAFAAGLSVTGSENGIRYRYYPDGTKEVLGPVAPLPPIPK